MLGRCDGTRGIGRLLGWRAAPLCAPNVAHDSGKSKKLSGSVSRAASFARYLGASTRCRGDHGSARADEGRPDRFELCTPRDCLCRPRSLRFARSMWVCSGGAAPESAAAMTDRDIVLALPLSAPRWPLDDLTRFRRVWSSLLSRNPSLSARLHSVLLLVEGDADAARPAAREASASLPDVVVQILAAPTLGRSLNDAALWLRGSGAPYLLVWDDAHEAARPFLESALNALLRSPDVWLLRLDATAADDARAEQRDGCVVVRPHPDEATKLSLDPAFYDAVDADYAEMWPSFSLGPGLHRATTLAEAVFDEAADVTWPELQWRFGLSWEAAGGVVAVLEPPPARYVYGDAMEP